MPQTSFENIFFGRGEITSNKQCFLFYLVLQICFHLQHFPFNSDMPLAFQWYQWNASRIYHWHTSGISLGYQWFSQWNIGRFYHWHTSGISMGYRWFSQWNTSGFHWNTGRFYHCMPVEYQWYTSGMPVAFQWNTNGFTSGILADFTDCMPVEYQWYTSGIPVYFFTRVVCGLGQDFF